MIKMYIGPCKVHIILVQVLIKLEFPQQIFKKYSNIKFMKTCPVGTKLFHEDRRTERHDIASSRFLQFCKCA